MAASPAVNNSASLPAGDGAAASGSLLSSAAARPPKVESFTFNGWNIRTAKGIILNKDQAETIESELKLPHIPDMVFPSNRMTLTYAGDDGGASVSDKADNAAFAIEFDPLSALRKVDNSRDLIRVSLSEQWLEARKDSPHIKNVVRPYDWTFTPSSYRGVLTSAVAVEQTEERIDYEKLKERERILFFDDVLLYEDELDDNGCAKLSCKIRVMPSGFFCLLRFYLRVDATLIRVHDTRLYHRVGDNHLIREFTERESTAKELEGLPRTLWIDQNGIVDRLNLKKTINEKITFRQRNEGKA